MRCWRLTVINVWCHIPFHHRIMIMVRGMIFFENWRWSYLDCRDSIIHVLSRHTIMIDVSNHRIINYLLSQRIITYWPVWKMTLMSLILWCSPSSNLQVVLMLRHYIIWSLFKFLYRFLHWIFICNAHVIHIRLIHPVRRLTRLECRILNLWWLFPTDTPVVIAKCGISQVRRRIHSQPPMIWIPLENLDLTPFDLLTSGF